MDARFVQEETGLIVVVSCFFFLLSLLHHVGRIQPILCRCLKDENDRRERQRYRDPYNTVSSHNDVSQGMDSLFPQL